MASYTRLNDVEGDARVDMVLRDDGAFVLTGQAIGPNGVVGLTDFANPDTLAFRAWLEAGNTPGEPIGPSLAAVQASLCSDIDSQAEGQRLRYITPGAAQMGTYLLKRGQALSAIANQAADAAANKTAAQLAAAYPYMANEIGITVDPSTKAPATDVYGVARAVSAISVSWQALDLAIERVRLTTKVAISAAPTAGAAQAAHDAVTWPAPPAA